MLRRNRFGGDTGVYKVVKGSEAQGVPSPNGKGSLTLRPPSEL